MAERRAAYRVLVGKHGGTRSLGRPGVEWIIILKLILRKWNGGWGMDWIELAQDVERCGLL
jgi:hypothetical protein